MSENPMAGPSIMTLILNGAKFVPCMKSTQEDILHYQTTCPSVPSFTNETCTLSIYYTYVPAWWDNSSSNELNEPSVHWDTIRAKIKRTNTRMATSTGINHRLLESIRDEPKRMLVPISGYEKVIVRSLEDACETIKDLFDDQLKQFIIIAKMNSSDVEDKLTQDESASIHLYTMEWEEHGNSLYMKLNQTLRLADRFKLKPWFKYLKLLLTAFFKLPPSEGTLVWRGVREDLSALYPKGKEFAWWAFSSCSSSIDVLESPNYLGKSGTRTIFSIQTKSGKLIRAHSYFDNEDEILLPPGIYLKVVGSLNPAINLHIIHLQEIEPPYKMLADPFDLSELKHALPPAKPPSYMIYPQKEEEYSSPTSVLSKPSIQPSFEKGKFIVFLRYDKVFIRHFCEVYRSFTAGLV
ncbi:unnamed protein product [Adineta steineri]|uniref:NAD(P)(+)--arginine ADP-ribosyltransferase n=1 Tax=Adineta steineri TaxID=433720 RepID=A0A813TFU2_9BILA|nr:unnamed protein product [Adineta steineri]CAF3868089.1 unnamed protein product [Adineta steineri]